MKGEFDLGRDLDEMAMSMDRRTIAKRVRDLLKRIVGAEKESDYTRAQDEILRNIGQDSELL